MKRGTPPGTAALATFMALAVTSGVAFAKDPWPAREPYKDPKPAHQLRTIATWPSEPTPPTPVDRTKFHEAFAKICEVPLSSSVAALSAHVLTVATETKTDPFLITALARVTSGCKPKYNKDGQFGFMALEPEMYFSEGAPEPPFDKEDWKVRRLLDPVANIKIGATLLAMWEQSHKKNDEAFGGVPHRSAASHMIWGDVVRSSGQEDHVLTARRRMVTYYSGATELPRPSPYGIDVVSPLEAPPRVATSGPGDARDGGRRSHRGLDIVGTVGEPVRAVADGVVIFAGVNMPGAKRKGPIPPNQIKRYAWRRLGVGGIYLCIEHTPEPRKVVSCYMHLASYNVAEREEVKAGQVIGQVGRTGVKVSPPHLHFEIRVGETFTNPARTLGDYVIPPKATMAQYYRMKAKRLKRLRASAEAAARRDKSES